MRTEQEIAAMKEHAANIQPEVERNKYCDPKDFALYDDMSKLYKDLSDKDISFNLFFTSKDTGSTYSFFRVCAPEEQERYQKTCVSRFWHIWNWLVYCGFDKHLEKCGIIKVLKNTFGGKTCEEEVGEILNKEDSGQN